MAISPEALAELTRRGAERGVDLSPGLTGVETLLREVAANRQPLVAEASSYLVDAGGKRFRPMLVLLGGMLGGLPPDDARLVQGGAIVELVHLSTLYHDDVIDGAVERRGAPAAHVRWSNTVAVLTGDFLLARASELSAELGIEATRLMARTIATLCEGEIREVTGAGGPRARGAVRVAPDREHYLHVIAEKTASLIAASLRLGGIVGALDSAALETLSSFGHHLGMAFQLADDVLDIRARRTESGKTPGTDLREGVRTLPVLLALEDEGKDSELAQLVAECVGAREDDEAVEKALKLLREHPALDLARDAARLEAGRAAHYLDALAVGAEAEVVRRGLAELADYATDRLA